MDEIFEDLGFSPWQPWWRVASEGRHGKQELHVRFGMQARCRSLRRERERKREEERGGEKGNCTFLAGKIKNNTGHTIQIFART